MDDLRVLPSGEGGNEIWYCRLVCGSENPRHTKIVIDGTRGPRCRKMLIRKIKLSQAEE